MCGITGFSAPKTGAREILRRMTDSLGHRGPDATGLFVDNDIAFGHRRLTVIDPIGGAQPRVDLESRDVLIYNGEIYGYHEHAATLRQKGIRLVDNSDTEVLFQYLRRWGVMGTLQRLQGMFAFAFREGTSGRTYLARDRFGEKPLFYAVRDSTLIFGSEIKALLQHPDLTGTSLATDAIDRYLTFEFLPGHDSGFQNIRKLEPGHLLVFDRGQVTIEPYWQLRHETLTDISEADAIDRLDDLLRRSVEQRLIADVPIGVFLSGGIDSSLIAAISREFSPSITAYTIKMTNASFDESEHATAVARHCGLAHRVQELGASEILGAFAALYSKIDEPMADYSLLPTYLVCKLARERETVCLGGDGADELFGGYGVFRARRFSAMMAQLPRRVGTWTRALLDCLPHSERYMSADFVIRHVSHGFGHLPEHQSILWVGPFAPEERQRLWRPEYRPQVDDEKIFVEIDRLLTQRHGQLSPAGAILDLYLRTYLPENILTKLDRSAMAVSLETRLPYLDQAFAEFAASLPVGYKVRGRQTKYILKKLALRYLPPEIVFRKKQGFGFPLAEFLRTALRAKTQEILLDGSNPIAAWFDQTEIERYLMEHGTGARNHRKKIWALLILFVAARRSLEGASSAPQERLAGPLRP